MDESGYTGTDLLNRSQPVLAISSHRYTEQESIRLKTEFFKRVQAPELKYSMLAKSPRHRQAILELLASLPGGRRQVKVYVFHKRFGLLTKIVDLFIIESMHYTGLDLYSLGGHIPLANLLWFTLPVFGGQGFFDQLLTDFQSMLISRTLESYERFFRPVRLIRGQQKLDELLDYLRIADRVMGYAHLRNLHGEPEVAHAGAMALVQSWRRSLPRSPFQLIHDRSSAIANNWEAWQALTSPDNPPLVIGTGDERFVLPLNVRETRLAISHEHVGLQMADVLAGAVAAAWRGRAIEGEESEYSNSLAAALGELPSQILWPNLSIKPVKQRGSEQLISYTQDALHRYRGR